MAAAKMWTRRLIVAVGVLAFGAAASGIAYRVAGVATSIGALALAR